MGCLSQKRPITRCMRRTRCLEVPAAPRHGPFFWGGVFQKAPVGLGLHDDLGELRTLKLLERFIALRL
jgi:hypothetical protein